MNFDARPLDKIDDAELAQLVENRVPENQHLEYKLSIDLKTEAGKLEFFEDIAALANGGGGYLLVGVREDGQGRPLRFEMFGDDDYLTLQKRISQLCLDHIVERIHGIEMQRRLIDGKEVLVLRVPKSERTPHMVKFNRKTIFVTRYQDGKREMTFSEIRDAFNGDIVARRLGALDEGIRLLRSKQDESSSIEIAKSALQAGSLTTLLTMSKGEIVHQMAQEYFQAAYVGQRVFWISATPGNPQLGLFDYELPEHEMLLRSPPGARYAGWDMKSTQIHRQLTAMGWRFGELGWRILDVWRNGHMEFFAPINEDFCYRQPLEDYQKRPIIHALILIEFTTSFLRLFAAFMKQTGQTKDALFSIYLGNIRGVGIRSLDWFEQPSASSEDHILLSDIHLQPGFDPDVTAYKILRPITAALGSRISEIPCWSAEEERFVFPQSS